MAAQVAIRRRTNDRLLVEDSQQTACKQDFRSSRVITLAGNTQPWNDYAAAQALMSLSS